MCKIPYLNVVNCLLLLNIFAFCISYLTHGQFMPYVSLYYVESDYFRPWQFVTSIFFAIENGFVDMSASIIQGVWSTPG